MASQSYDCSNVEFLLPKPLADWFAILPKDNLVDVSMDLGRYTKARYTNGFSLHEILVSEGDISHVAKKIGEFNSNNRAGVQYSLHRVSAIRTHDASISGLTIRIGRDIPNLHLSIKPILDGKCLILGKPGSGKTSVLRSIAKYLSSEKNMEVMVVDKSDEIAGCGVIPHKCIGLARRMSVLKSQADTIVEAIENHTPHVVIVDEISNKQESHAIKTAGERGIQIIATAHGNALEDAINNPALQPVLGGVVSVTLGDDAAKKRETFAKTAVERIMPATFDSLAILDGFDEVKVYTDLSGSIDAVLAGKIVKPDVYRKIGDDWLLIQHYGVSD